MCCVHKLQHPFLEISTAFMSGGGGGGEGCFLHRVLSRKRKALESWKRTSFESVCTSPCPCLSPAALGSYITFKDREREGGREWERDGEGNDEGRKVHTKE